MAGQIWTEEEENYLKSNYQEKTCEEIAKDLNRTIRSVQHKFGELKLKRKKAKVGDVVNGWKIIEIFSKYNGSQYVSYAKIESTLEDKIVKEERLTKLTLAQIGWPDRRRPDLIEQNTTHGMSRSRLYRIWCGMKVRCGYTSTVGHKNYSGRGIKVCQEWVDSFDKFKLWSEENGYSEDLTLDRINADGNYESSNCRWATKIQQTANKRTSNKEIITAFGETKNLYEWMHDSRCSVTIPVLEYRIQAGWNPEDIISKPSERGTKTPLKQWLKENHPEILEEYYK